MRIYLPVLYKYLPNAYINMFNYIHMFVFVNPEFNIRYLVAIMITSFCFVTLVEIIFLTLNFHFILVSDSLVL